MTTVYEFVEREKLFNKSVVSQKDYGDNPTVDEYYAFLYNFEKDKHPAPDDYSKKSLSEIEKEAAESKRIAEIKANIDALTGVKNRRAYLNTEEQLNSQIAENSCMEFAIVIADVNNLKAANDTFGHKVGDEILSNACKILCNTFSHSPVFRIGGDEFAVVAQGSDYDNIDKLTESLISYNKNALREGGVVIACGMSKFENDSCVASVFERADRNMYENKNSLKSQI